MQEAPTWTSAWAMTSPTSTSRQDPDSVGREPDRGAVATDIGPSASKASSGRSAASQRPFSGYERNCSGRYSLG